MQDCDRVRNQPRKRDKGDARAGPRSALAIEGAFNLALLCTPKGKKKSAKGGSTRPTWEKGKERGRYHSAACRGRTAARKAVD